MRAKEMSHRSRERERAGFSPLRQNGYYESLRSGVRPPHSPHSPDSPHPTYPTHQTYPTYPTYPTDQTHPTESDEQRGA